jgi:hypothetical protein
MIEWIRWPLMAKSAAGGIGLGLIYAVATGEFGFGVILGLMTGLGFGVGRSYDLR